MDFTLQSFGPFLHWLTLVVLCLIPIFAVYVIYRVGKLPGDIARSRHHPQASAISICGWMGVVALVLWPLALIWACLATGPLFGDAKVDNDDKALIKRLHEARQRLAALEHQVSHTHSGE